MGIPINTHYNYRQIALYFTEKTKKHSSFVQDKKTMFLTIDNEVYKEKRINKCTEELNVKKVIEIFEKRLF